MNFVLWRVAQYQNPWCDTFFRTVKNSTRAPIPIAAQLHLDDDPFAMPPFHDYRILLRIVSEHLLLLLGRKDFVFLETAFPTFSNKMICEFEYLYP